MDIHSSKLIRFLQKIDHYSSRLATSIQRYVFNSAYLLAISIWSLVFSVLFSMPLTVSFLFLFFAFLAKIAENIMAASPINLDSKQRIKEISRSNTFDQIISHCKTLINDGEQEKAEKIIIILEDLIGKDDPDVAELRNVFYAETLKER